MPGIHGATAPPAWRAAGTAIVEVFPTPDGSSQAGRDLVGRVRAVAHGGQILLSRTTPELLYLEAKFAGLMSYGLSANLLGELLQLGL